MSNSDEIMRQPVGRPRSLAVLRAPSVLASTTGGCAGECKGATRRTADNRPRQPRHIGAQNGAQTDAGTCQVCPTAQKSANGATECAKCAVGLKVNGDQSGCVSCAAGKHKNDNTKEQ